ncbi:MAG: hypothetical protein HOV79_29670 [Hamadaea sp.]|nr:hypothetical protein [Hamadaea sp.]
MTRRGLAVAVFAAGLLLAGCASKGGPEVASAGGQRPAPSGSAMPSPAADEQERALQFQRCMADHGVEVQTSTEKGAVEIAASPGQKDKLMAATDACQMYLPAGVKTGPRSAEDIEKLRQHSACMREHGVPEWPDPDAEGNIRFADDQQALAMKKNPKVAAAFEACRSFSPDAGKGTAAK